MNDQKNRKYFSIWKAENAFHCFPAAAKILTVSLLTAALIIAQTGCGAAEDPEGWKENEAQGKEAASCEPVTKESFYFDTICQITIYGIRQDAETANNISSVSSKSSESESAEVGNSVAAEQTEDTESAAFQKEAMAVIDDAFSLCNEYEKLLSKTKEGSDIWNVNHAGGEAVSCDPRTMDVVEKGISYGALSGGRFDITVGKAEDLWNFHSENPKVPEKKNLEEAVSHVDYRNILVDEKDGTLQLADPETEIDLGGIAKGYIADAVCRKLREEKVTSAIVSLGGNIECIGGKPDVTGFTTEETSFSSFTIGIETPYSDRTEITGSSPLSEGTMVTSGVYERYFTQDGREYHHILDTKTGYPAESDVLGVTIKGKEGTSADCDALSTICLILGSEKGMQLIEKTDGYEAVFLLRDGSVQKTAGMDFTPAK